MPSGNKPLSDPTTCHWAITILINSIMIHVISTFNFPHAFWSLMVIGESKTKTAVTHSMKLSLNETSSCFVVIESTEGCPTDSLYYPKLWSGGSPGGMKDSHASCIRVQILVFKKPKFQVMQCISLFRFFWLMAMLLLLLSIWIEWNRAWISNYIHYKVWDEITYPFLNFNMQSLMFGNG